MQADGSLALPVILGGKHHLLGDMDVVGEGLFKGVVTKLLEVFKTNKEKIQIILPPIPRYVSGSCCEDMSHANNCRDPKLVQGLCSKLGSLRKTLKEMVVKSQIGNVWIPDMIEGLFGTREGEGRDPAEAGGAAGGLYSKDNVHLSQMGIDKLKIMILTSIEKAISKRDAAAVLSVTGSERFYWRGFCSARGTTRPTKQWSSAVSDSVRGNRAHRGFHPYARGSGNGGRGSRGGWHGGSRGGRGR